MDPTQTLADLFSAVHAGDAEEAHEKLQALHEWISEGGYAPSVAEALGRAALDA